MWSIMPRSQVTSGFFRIQMLIVLGLGMLATLSMGQLTAGTAVDNLLISNRTATVVAALIAAAAFCGSVVWTLDRRSAGSFFVYLIAATAVFALLATNVPPASLSTLNGGVHLLSELSTAALLGGAMTGMLLGHWYLTAPTMSIAPLHRLTVYFGIASTVRFALSAVGLLLAWDQIAAAGQWNTTHTVWLVLRWLAGILGPLAVFVMVWRILKYKNTQAATGVLFVGVILTFIGEMTASLLFQDLQRPL